MKIDLKFTLGLFFGGLLMVFGSIFSSQVSAGTCSGNYTCVHHNDNDNTCSGQDGATACTGDINTCANAGAACECGIIGGSGCVYNCTGDTADQGCRANGCGDGTRRICTCSGSWNQSWSCVCQS